jgi:hypothetical protein
VAAGEEKTREWEGQKKCRENRTEVHLSRITRGNERVWKRMVCILLEDLAYARSNDAG